MKQEFGYAHQDMMVNLITPTGVGYHNANAANDVPANNYCLGNTKARTNLAAATKSN